MPKCTRDHEHLKRDRREWEKLQLVPGGGQPDGLGGVLEMRNCTCGSTLSWAGDQCPNTNYRESHCGRCGADHSGRDQSNGESQ